MILDYQTVSLNTHVVFSNIKYSKPGMVAKSTNDILAEETKIFLRSMLDLMKKPIHRIDYSL